MTKHYKKKILLVDDDIEFRKAMARMFEKSGYIVYRASDGLEALDVLSAEEIDLVISDLRMPSLDGTELIVAIKRIGLSMPIIFVTAFGEVESYMDVMNLGAFKYVNKPVKANEILSIAKEALSEFGATGESGELFSSAVRAEIARLEIEIAEGRKKAEPEEVSLQVRFVAFCAAIAHGMKREFMHMGNSVKTVAELAGDRSDVCGQCGVIKNHVQRAESLLRNLHNHLTTGLPITVDFPEVIPEAEETKLELEIRCLQEEFKHIARSVNALLELSDVQSDMREQCGVIETGVGYSMFLLQRLQNYLEIDQPVITTVDVFEIIDRIEMLIRPRLPSKVELRIQFDCNKKEALVSANAEQLMMVLIELINNASDALRRKGGAIKFQLVERDEDTTISVKDNGPGIPRKRKANLFRKTSLSKSGHGLGLYLSKKVIDALRGDFDLKTSKKGTIITISLPKAAREEARNATN